jgi:hypothetical protein
MNDALGERAFAGDRRRRNTTRQLLEHATERETRRQTEVRRVHSAAVHADIPLRFD